MYKRASSSFGEEGVVGKFGREFVGSSTCGEMRDIVSVLLSVEGGLFTVDGCLRFDDKCVLVHRPVMSQNYNG